MKVKHFPQIHVLKMYSNLMGEINYTTLIIQIRWAQSD